MPITFFSSLRSIFFFKFKIESFSVILNIFWTFYNNSFRFRLCSCLNVRVIDLQDFEPPQKLVQELVKIRAKASKLADAEVKYDYTDLISWVHLLHLSMNIW